MAVCNITVENDHDFYCLFRYTTISNVPIDITGCTMVMMLRRHATDKESVMKLTTDPNGGIVLVDPVNGGFSVRVPQVELERMPLGDFDHSLVLTQGEYKRGIWTGTFTINAGPSR